MSLLNRNSRKRNAYASNRRSAEEARSRTKSGGNRKTRSSSKGGKTRKTKRTFPALRLSLRGVLRFLGWASAMAFVGLILFGGAVGFLKAYQFCTTSSYFAVTNISVTGNLQVKTADILNACGLRKGVNSLTIDVHEAEQTLIRNPWIESVTIRRELPGDFTIIIKEREPRFCARKDKKLHYVTDEGDIIAPVTAANFRSLPVLEMGYGGDEALPLVPSFLDLFDRSGFPFKVVQATWVKLSAASGFELYWETRRLHLSIGLENWQENLKRIASVVNDIEKRKETMMVTSIRSADGQVWMTKKPEKTAEK